MEFEAASASKNMLLCSLFSRLLRSAKTCRGRKYMRPSCLVCASRPTGEAALSPSLETPRSMEASEYARNEENKGSMSNFFAAADVVAADSLCQKRLTVNRRHAHQQLPPRTSPRRRLVGRNDAPSGLASGGGMYPKARDMLNSPWTEIVAPFPWPSRRIQMICVVCGHWWWACVWRAICRLGCQTFFDKYECRMTMTVSGSRHLQFQVFPCRPGGFQKPETGYVPASSWFVPWPGWGFR